MPWTPDQRQRLAVEKSILDQYFPGRVQWIDPTADTKVEVTMTSNSNQVYCLRVYVPGDFPNSLPDLVVCRSPRVMPNWGGSSSTHTLGKRDNCLKICHYFAPRWNPQHTFYEILLKGRLWLEAYEGHLSTGRKMDYYLGHMR